MITLLRKLFSIVLSLFLSCLIIHIPYTSARNIESLLASRIDIQAEESDMVPRAVGQTDNLDPSAADPHNSITCLGSTHELVLPVQSDFNPYDVTMQQLCAKTQFNGGKPYQHIGGWCNWSPKPDLTQVAFDLSAAAQINPVYANPRVMLACFNRCFCNFGLSPGQMAIQPKAATNNAYEWQSEQTYELQAHLTDDYDTVWTEQMKPAALRGPESKVDAPTTSHKGKQGKSLITVAEVQTLSQLTRKAAPFTLERSTYLSMSPQNEIECHGSLPLWPLPAPYNKWDFSTVQQLCSVVFFGGNSGANAGGYCHRSDLPDGSLQSSVWFSDEFTPREDWTWDGPNFYAAAAIRTHCYFRCQCANLPTKNDSVFALMTNPVWTIIQNQHFAVHKDGSVTLDDAATKQNEAQVLPPQTPGANRLHRGPVAGTCGARGEEFCPATWPKEVLGDVRQMQSPPGATLVVTEVGDGDAVGPPTNQFGAAGPTSSNQKPNTQNDLTKCGSTCESMSDCRKGDSKDGCACAEPSWNDIKRLGLDPIAGTSKGVCLVLALAAVGISGRDLDGSGIGLGGEDGVFGGHDVGRRFLNEEGEAYRCRCNGTFVAEECCGSGDGMVWVG